MSEIALLNQRFDGLDSKVTSIDRELKQVNVSLTNLIRIDGNIKRIEEKIDRIGQESDDHEERLRKLEARSGNMLDTIIASVFAMVLGGIVMFFFMSAVTGHG